MNWKPYIGQEVVCINVAGTEDVWGCTPLVKGQHYFITVISKGCCVIEISVGIKTEKPIKRCNVCGNLSKQSPDRPFIIHRFAPIDEIPESHNEAIKELLKEELILS